MIDPPARMAKLERDPRGYPVPFIVLRDNDGTPHFTVNDSARAAYCVAKDLCAVCGQKLLRGRWFLGGPGSAFDPRGAYFDGPMHGECCAYAAQVCPYLSRVRYPGRLDGKTIDWAKMPDTITTFDPTVDPSRPEVFVAVHARGQKLTPHGYMAPSRPYIDVRFWRHGKRIDEAEARPYLPPGYEKAMRRPAGRPGACAAGD